MLALLVSIAVPLYGYVAGPPRELPRLRIAPDIPAEPCDAPKLGIRITNVRALPVSVDEPKLITSDKSASSLRPREKRLEIIGQRRRTDPGFPVRLEAGEAVRVIYGARRMVDHDITSVSVSDADGNVSARNLSPLMRTLAIVFFSNDEQKKLQEAEKKHPSRNAIPNLPPADPWCAAAVASDVAEALDGDT